MLAMCPPQFATHQRHGVNALLHVAQMIVSLEQCLVLRRRLVVRVRGRNLFGRYAKFLGHVAVPRGRWCGSYRCRRSRVGGRGFRRGARTEGQRNGSREYADDKCSPGFHDGLRQWLANPHSAQPRRDRSQTVPVCAGVAVRLMTYGLPVCKHCGVLWTQYARLPIRGKFRPGAPCCISHRSCSAGSVLWWQTGGPLSDRTDDRSGAGFSPSRAIVDGRRRSRIAATPAVGGTPARAAISASSGSGENLFSHSSLLRCRSNGDSSIVGERNSMIASYALGGNCALDPARSTIDHLTALWTDSPLAPAGVRRSCGRVGPPHRAQQLAVLPTNSSTAVCVLVADQRIADSSS